jgi:RHS repeat-associated protein
VPHATYFGHDQIGSTTAELDDAGAVIGQRSYFSFGADRSSTGDTDRYAFTGQEADATGMVHFQFRQLDPSIGRWTAPDPLFSACDESKIENLGEATTAYAYVANNPANSVDPTGLVNYRATRGYHAKRLNDGHVWVSTRATSVDDTRRILTNYQGRELRNLVIVTGNHGDRRGGHAREPRFYWEDRLAARERGRRYQPIFYTREQMAREFGSVKDGLQAMTERGYDVMLAWCFSERSTDLPREIRTPDRYRQGRRRSL